MTDLMAVLRDLNPVPHPIVDDEQSQSRRVAAIVSVPDVELAVPEARPGRPTLRPAAAAPSRRHPRARDAITGHRVAAAGVVALTLALVLTSVGVTRGWLRPLGGQVPAGGTVDTLFGPDIDRDTIAPALTSQGAAPLTLWSATSRALGTCLAVTSDGGRWLAAPAIDGTWRPLPSGAACLDSRLGGPVSDQVAFIARFVDRSRDGGGREVFAGRVKEPAPVSVITELGPSDEPMATVTLTPDNGPTSAVVRTVAVSTDAQPSQESTLRAGWFLTPPVDANRCPTVVARNGAGRTVWSDVQTAGCAGSPVPVATVGSGSTQPDVLLNNNRYADGLSAGLSAVTERDPARAAGDTSGMTVLTLSVQFFDACQSPPGPSGLPPFPDPCLDRRIAIPTDVDLQLFYGAAHTAATPDPGRGGPDDDFASPPTPGYVGGKVFGLLVYRTFLVPSDELGSLTARWTGDTLHAPLVMQGVQRAIR